MLGLLDEVVLYPALLSDANVTNLYQSYGVGTVGRTVMDAATHCSAGDQVQRHCRPAVAERLLFISKYEWYRLSGVLQQGRGDSVLAGV